MGSFWGEPERTASAANVGRLLSIPQRVQAEGLGLFGREDQGDLRVLLAVFAAHRDVGPAVRAGLGPLGHGFRRAALGAGEARVPGDLRRPDPLSVRKGQLLGHVTSLAQRRRTNRAAGSVFPTRRILPPDANQRPHRRHTVRAAGGESRSFLVSPFNPRRLAQILAGTFRRKTRSEGHPPGALLVGADRGFTTVARWYSMRCMEQQRERVHREYLEGSGWRSVLRVSVRRRDPVRDAGSRCRGGGD